MQPAGYKDAKHLDDLEETILAAFQETGEDLTLPEVLDRLAAHGRLDHVAIKSSIQRLLAQKTIQLSAERKLRLSGQARR